MDQPHFLVAQAPDHKQQYRACLLYTSNRRYRRYLLLGFALILLLLIILSRCQQGTPYYSAAEDYAPQAFDDLLLGQLFTVEVEQDISWRAVAAVYLALTSPDARGQEEDLPARLAECRALLPLEGPVEGQARDYFRAALGQPGGDAAWSQYVALNQIDRVFQGKQFPLALDANFDYADSWQQSRNFGAVSSTHLRWYCHRPWGAGSV